MAGKTAQALWQDYCFLTKEMMKFLTKQDMALFYHLVDQRERLQISIGQTADDGFKVSLEGQSLLAEIQQESQEIIHNLQLHINHSKRQHQVSETYSGAGHAPVSRMSWQR